jgi:nitric oxide reductase NorQ protein
MTDSTRRQTEQSAHERWADADHHAAMRYPGPDAPYYLPVGDEIAVFETCHARRLAVMLKGPTGCGKTRFVEHMAWRLGRPLVTVACHDDLSASDPPAGTDSGRRHAVARRAAHPGREALCDFYLDEIIEARTDTVVVIHPLTDDRRILPLDKARAAGRGSTVSARGVL